MNSNFKRSLLTGLFVGGILILINHLDTVLYGKITPIVIFKIVITPLVPFCVSFYSAKYAILKNNEQDNRSP